MRPTLRLRYLPLLVLALLPAPLYAQNRRTTPGLVLETGARHATCDKVVFSPAGDELLAVGEDKVVRIWRVGKKTLFKNTSRTLRWPIFREQRGSIYAMALSPNDSGRRVAIGGHGLINGTIAVLDRTTGAMLHIMEKPTSSEATWAIAWSPNGRYTVHGTGAGELFRWEPASGAKSPTQLAGSTRSGNRVRLIAFENDRTFLAVKVDGQVSRYDALSPTAAPTKVASFTLGNLIRVALSPDKRWLAAAGQGVGGKAEATQRVELIDLHKPGAAPLVIKVPQAADRWRYPTEMAFDATSTKLAVGTQEANILGAGQDGFSRVTGGSVHVWTLNGGKPTRTTRDGMQVGYMVEAMAFRPPRGDNPDARWQLAVAGGPNHEVRLFDVRKEAEPLSEVRGPGSGIWQVAMSTNKKYIAWREQLNDRPANPNDRAKGPWRVFTLDEKTRRILPTKPADFKPQLAIARLADWHVEMTDNPFVWRVRGPEGTNVPLDATDGRYLAGVNNLPRCWTFLPAVDKKPPRLAVGHQWGLSLYELRPNDVRLARLMVGHEGQVYSVAPSPDGKLLLTAGRDMTLACWSLEDWPTNRELGASFVVQPSGKVLVRRVDPGSPAWEAGLTDDDEVTMVVSIDRDKKGGFVYDAEKVGLKKHGFRMSNPRFVDARSVVKLLNRAEPNREYIFVWRHNGVEQKQLTTVRQRPLWRFFPTRKEEGSNWIIWRWRDFYYDTTAPDPDRLLGWQVHGDDLKKAPDFHPLSNFSGSAQHSAKGQRLGFHNPSKVWATVKLPFNSPERVLFPDIEPPEVDITVAQQPVKDAKVPANDRPLILKCSVRPHNKTAPQRLSRTTLWLDDSRFEPAPAINPMTGQVQTTVTIPLARLRQGRNEITLSCFNAQGGRGEKTVVVNYDDPTRPMPSLLALCVGVNDYGKAKNFPGIKNLTCPVPDAEALTAVFRQHSASKLYRRSKVELLRGADVTRGTIRKRLLQLRQEAKPDDLFILFLSGHGATTSEDEFFYFCADADSKRPQTLLTGNDLMSELAAIPCRKLILLDACHSGSFVTDPIRSLTTDGARFVIFAACQPGQEANEPSPIAAKKKPALAQYKHGFFTEGLLTALGNPAKFNPKVGRKVPITARQTAETVRAKIASLLTEFEERPDAQTPVFLPRPEKLSREEMFCRP